MADIQLGGDEVVVDTPVVTIPFFAPGLTAMFKVNGVDITQYVASSKITRTNGYQCSMAEITAPKMTFTPLVGQTVEIWSQLSDGSSFKEFSGAVDSVEPDAGIFTITAYDKLYAAVKLNAANRTYDRTVDTQAGKIHLIFEDLLSQTGLNYVDGTTIQPTTSAGMTLDKFVCADNDIFERLMTLAQAVGWQFYYRADADLVYFEPKGFRSASLPLVLGTNITSHPDWTNDTTEMVNVLYLKGAVASVQTRETFSGDGVTVAFNLLHIPTDIQVQYPVGTILKGGVANSTTTYDYYTNDFVTQDGTHIPQLVFTAAPAGGASNIQVNYSYDEPTPIVIYGPQASRNAYGDYQKTVVLPSVLTVQDAYTYGQTMVNQYSSPFVKTTFNIYDTSATYYVGQTVVVTDALSGYSNQTMVINTQTISYPSPIDTLSCGQKDWMLADSVTGMQQRIAAIEQDLAGQSTTSYLAVGVGVGATFSRKTLVIEERNPNTTFVYNVGLPYNAGYKYNDQSTVTATTTINY